MSQDYFLILQKIIIWLVPGLLAITLHEVAHGWAALMFGDTTARDAGRLSLNPVKHIDPFGTLVLPGLMLLAHLPFLFGWAKPVPVDFRRLNMGRLSVVLVALAGPLANILMLLCWWGLARVLAAPIGLNDIPGPALTFAIQVALSGVMINAVLALFNLIPLPPLDGGRMVAALLPNALARPYMQLERFGILILLALMATGLFGRVFQPALQFIFAKLGL